MAVASFTLIINADANAFTIKKTVDAYTIMFRAAFYWPYYFCFFALAYSAVHQCVAIVVLLIIAQSVVLSRSIDSRASMAVDASYVEASFPAAIRRRSGWGSFSFTKTIL